MSNFNGFVDPSRMWCIPNVRYSIRTKFRVFLRNHNRPGSIPTVRHCFSGENRSKKEPKSVGQGRCFEPLLQSPRPVSPSSDKIFSIGQFLITSPSPPLEIQQLRMHCGGLWKENGRDLIHYPPPSGGFSIIHPHIMRDPKKKHLNWQFCCVARRRFYAIGFR